MEILLIMGMGILFGAKFFPQKWKSYNEKVQLVCTLLLIFSMGITLGRRENLIKELSEIGWSSLLLAVIPIIASVIMVYFLTEWLMKPKRGGKK